VRDLIAGQGYQVANVDVVVVAESPRIAPFVPEMRKRISAVLGIPSDAIGIKATTNEGVGPEGRHEAISACAVALVHQ
jgi:2-C-methyl-D-erythritol 2,4-cyclodiphosphate synthase